MQFTALTDILLQKKTHQTRMNLMRLDHQAVEIALWFACNCYLYAAIRRLSRISSVVCHRTA